MLSSNYSVLYALMLLIAGWSCNVCASIDVSQINMNDIQQQLPSEFANTNLTLDDAKTLMRDKCIQVQGEEKGLEAYKEIEATTMTLGECIGSIVNYTAIQAEIEEASPRGELDVVFTKYCLKRPMALQCIESFTEKLVPCLEKEEKENQDVFIRIVRSLLNFICHKGGDQIALFIAEEGPECLESKKDDIQQCLNNTLSAYMPKDGFENGKTLPKFVMSQKQCGDIQVLETCIVSKLETCNEITPANIIESMFRFIKNETICRSNSAVVYAKQSSGNGSGAASSAAMNGVVLLLSLFLICFAILKRLEV